MLTFSTKVLNWHQQFGRHRLPWQKNKTLYKIWLAEIMLQQTQVVTVIPYYQQFLQRFSRIEQLANAKQDEVLLLWAGLGYYARARNLHKTAKIIVNQYNAKFPQKFDVVLALPGIGRSTAGAILAQGLNQQYAILDGNVKRVLARYQMIAGWTGHSKVVKELWQFAEQYTPKENVANYTQAIMDLGATVCTRSKPKCIQCPLAKQCCAYQNNCTEKFPFSKPKKILPIKQKRFLIIQRKSGEYLLEKRNPSGIWGGLWSLPELALEVDIVQGVKQNLNLKVIKTTDLAVTRHSFSHFHLDITPCLVIAEDEIDRITENNHYQWQSDLSQLALASPVSRLLAN